MPAYVSSQGRHLPRWLVLSILAPALGLLIVVTSVPWNSVLEDAHGVGFLFLLYTAGEILYIPLPRGGGVSVGLAVMLACAAVYGPGVAALVSGLGIVVAMFIASRTSGLERYAYNFGQMTISSYMAGVTFRVVAGSINAQNLWATSLGCVAASAVFFVVNIVHVVLFLSSANGLPVRAFWPDVKHNLISYFALVPLGILVALIFASYGIPGSLLFLVPLLLARFSFLQYLNTRRASLSVTQALATALEAKDAYTRGHSDRVADYAETVARCLGMPEERVETLRYAAEMHDIGKISIPEALLNKPGSLNDDELLQVREHALIGAEMVSHVELLKGVSDIIRYHHEWFDGSKGYPKERTGSSIPVGARILMVCDAFDAMTSDRPYRAGLGEDEAIRRLQLGAGTQFDPGIVEVFIKTLHVQKHSAGNGAC